jgi:hypothetical protein
VTPAEAEAYLARWPEVASAERTALARMSLEAKFAQLVALTAAGERQRHAAARRDLEVAERWARIRADRKSVV